MSFVLPNILSLWHHLSALRTILEEGILWNVPQSALVFFQEQAESYLVSSCRAGQGALLVKVTEKPHHRQITQRKQYGLRSQTDLGVDSGPDTHLEDIGQVT